MTEPTPEQAERARAAIAVLNAYLVRHHGVSVSVGISDNQLAFTFTGTVGMKFVGREPGGERLNHLSVLIGGT